MEEDDNPPIAIPMDEVSLEVPTEPDAGAPVGVTVITGYLGAGKSTLVNYILNAQHGKRIAVILNEFGEEIGVERAMINEGQGSALVEEWVELANGCVCCTVKHSLVQALEQLVQRKERLDHILLETTGLADPAPLVSILWLDDQLESAIKLDSIVTVVDAKNLELQISKHADSGSFPETFIQIAFADIVILNKIDLISEEKEATQVENLKRKIHGINSLAVVICTTRCQVDLNKILNRESYSGESNNRWEELMEESKLLPSSSRHDSGVSTLSIHRPYPVDLDKVNGWLEDLLWEKRYSMDIYRCKGVLNVHNSNRIHTIQAVREVYEVVPGREWHEAEERINKLVFIGRDLDLKSLEDSFRGCLTIT
ncbi:COBW domain-containing protein 1 [Rhynchospora pubera]|uniref:COBW domain-containing protein 1 n=1 Tax=Rhynchospora pubera TaxID=906938 RepID=A0AAV8FKP3_9POAL|nr:COBW domain-containing protein 1 [Rhynchospora pubera]KAJ4815411.1 COBW domain-containing protein 1 [Rhynchospora pubera]